MAKRAEYCKCLYVKKETKQKQMQGAGVLSI